MTAYTLYYAPIRFLPYIETQEFVNLGVVGACHELHYLDFRLTTNKVRVNHFFPELEPDILIATRKHVRQNLNYFKAHMNVDRDALSIFDIDPKHFLEEFKYFVRPREGIIQFGNISMMRTGNVDVALNDIYVRYVERKFKHPGIYPEEAMKNRIRKTFKEHDITVFKNTKLGGDEYQLDFPFVYGNIDDHLSVIRPVSFIKKTATEIFDHADLWIARLKRLHDLGFNTQNDFLFPLSFENSKLGSKIRIDLDNYVKTCDFGSTKEWLNYASEIQRNFQEQKVQEDLRKKQIFPTFV